MAEILKIISEMEQAKCEKRLDQIRLAADILKNRRIYNFERPQPWGKYNGLQRVT